MVIADETIRAFIAITPAHTTRSALSDLIERLRSCTDAVSWVSPENLHLTLRFLGDIQDKDVDTLTDQLKEPLALIPSFALRIAGAGAFPNLRTPRVVWAGISNPPPELSQIHSTIEAAVHRLGFKPESRPFRPHISLGRVRRGSSTTSLPQALALEKNFDGSEFNVRAVSLFSSTLTPQGAIHSNIGDFPLQWTSTSA